MKFEFTYTIENEIEEVLSCYEDANFIIQNKYDCRLPSGNVLETLNKKKLVEDIKDDFAGNKVKYLSITNTIKHELNLKSKIIEKYFSSLGYKVPDKINIKFTLYGTEGNYKLPNIITIRFSEHDEKYINVIFHEILHLIIEKPVAEALTLEHFQKENLVDWILSETELNQLVSGYQVQTNYQNPSNEIINYFTKNKP